LLYRYRHASQYLSVCQTRIITDRLVYGGHKCTRNEAFESHLNQVSLPKFAIDITNNGQLPDRVSVSAFPTALEWCSTYSMFLIFVLLTITPSSWHYAHLYPDLYTDSRGSTTYPHTMNLLPNVIVFNRLYIVGVGVGRRIPCTGQQPESVETDRQNPSALLARSWRTFQRGLMAKFARG